MTLSSGIRFGPYEITGQLGAGGMGEVYRATDTKLGRDVAIKTLPGALASDKDRLARFEREAKLLAALNHPNIASVYGLDEYEGTLYLAMELVEGETLEEKLKRGALPVADALPLALQIAEALEAAHDKGVVHRDLKPANIMLTPNGQVKVLDFGLAKAFSSDPTESSPLHSPALSVAMTQAGLVLGTAGYMSPEQASGQATDQRSDIWGFGVVLYEMLTGLPLFKGESVPHILADVLKTEPDWTRLPDTLHPRIRQLLARCLTKKPRDRLHSIADARIEIEATLNDPHGLTFAPEAPETAPARSIGPLLAGAVAATAIVAGVAGWLLRPAPPPEPGAVVRFSAPLGEGQQFSGAPVSMIALSPDGTRLAYVADNQIYLRNLSEREARPVPGTAETGVGATTPAFSPDGQWLAYLAVSGTPGPYVIKRVPISGGAPVPVHEAEALPNFQQSLSWPEADTILFTNAEGVVRVPANGGATEVLVPRDDGERFQSPQLLPGGDAVLFTRLEQDPGTNGSFDTAEVVVQSIGADDRTVVWEGGSAARYLPTGHLVYAQGGSLYAIPFDPDRRAAGSGAVQMLSGLRRSSNGFSDTANLAISDNGTLAYIPGDPGGAATPAVETTLTWVDRNGREEPLPVRPDDYTAVRISPDGTRIALVIGRINPGGATNVLPSIWIYDLNTENLSLLTADPAGDDGPVWSTDGSRIYFRSLRNDSVGVYAIEVDTGETTLVATGTEEVPIPLPWSTSPEDRILALVSASSNVDINLATVSLEDGEMTILVSGEDPEFEPSIAPNGNWLAYQERFAGADPEINIRPFPGVSRTRIPVGPGQHSLFSSDGSELFYFDGQGLMAASIEYEPTLRVGRPERLFESPSAYLWNALGRAWDADPSGERFLLIRQPGAAAPGVEGERPRIDIVLNWTEELRTRVRGQ